MYRAQLSQGPLQPKDKIWALNIMSNTFPLLSAHIGSIHISNSAISPKLNCGPTKNGIFTVKSQYKILYWNLTQTVNPPPNNIPKILFKKFGAAEVTHDTNLWKCFIDILPTKERFNSFLKNISTTCPFCNTLETSQHLLLAYPYSRAVWFHLTRLKLDNFKNINLPTWGTRIMKYPPVTLTS